jgi:hypothetical protein
MFGGNARGPVACTSCVDFPAAPIVDSPDAGVPGDPASLFGPPSQGGASGGPCLIEPEMGALYPMNWLRPRFRWVPAGGENLFELRLHVQNQRNDLVVYTSATTWTMPTAMWGALAQDSAEQAMTVTVRGGMLANGQLSHEAVGSSGPIGVSSVKAAGSVVYWKIDPQDMTTSLKGFKVGDETVEDVLLPNQAPLVGADQPSCIGCHTASPDGQYVAFQTSSGTNYDNDIGAVVSGSVGQSPPFLTRDAKMALDDLAGAATMSEAHWTAGDRIELLSDTGDLHWVNLQGTGAQTTGVIPRGNADPGHAVSPSFGHDGNTIVYASETPSPINGRAGDGPFDLYLLHYNAKTGGDAARIPGASERDVNEFYPALSPDDAWIAFNRTDATVTQNTYDEPTDEVYVVPTRGGTPTRLAANDPPACLGAPSPGVTNSWPKWAPTQGSSGEGTVYWLVFSSRRWAGDLFPDGVQHPQLFVTAVVVDSQGNVARHGAIYLWNQVPTEDNHTPAWDSFQIPTQQTAQ